MKRSNQPKIEEPEIRIGASVWRSPSFDDIKGEITEINRKRVTIDFYDYIMEFHLDEIITKFIRGSNTIILACSPKAKGITIKTFKS